MSVNYSIDESYWEAFELHNEDIEYLYNYLLEKETPLNSQELIQALVQERIRRHKLELERQRTSGGDLFLPQGSYSKNQKLIFPALGWKRGQVMDVRPGNNPDMEPFSVIQVAMEDGSQRQFAAELAVHPLNTPPQFEDDDDNLDVGAVLETYQDDLIFTLEEDLETNSDFVRIAGRWFPRALLVDINIGHLNLAEAVLDMAGGGPLTTPNLISQIGLQEDSNQKLVEFSLDHSLQNDARFDEVGPSGDTLWFLHRLAPPEVLNTPLYLRYHEGDYDRAALKPEALALEQALDDELSPIVDKGGRQTEVDVRLIYPHWRSGTLPLSARLRHLFPTAYEAPRVRFILVDGDTGEKFPGWVVRERRYVFGLQDWYEAKGVMPGSIIKVRKGSQRGEVIVVSDSHRPTREWIRTVLVGSDGGVVFAMLKQIVSTPFDERMAIAIPDRAAVDAVWNTPGRDQPPLERVVVNMVKELARLNPQSHVHASELYAAINVVRRTPPGPLLALLATRQWFTHVGDMHYRMSDNDYN